MVFTMVLNEELLETCSYLILELETSGLSYDHYVISDCEISFIRQSNLSYILEFYFQKPYLFFCEARRSALVKHYRNNFGTFVKIIPSLSLFKCRKINLLPYSALPIWAQNVICIWHGRMKFLGTLNLCDLLG